MNAAIAASWMAGLAAAALAAGARGTAGGGQAAARPTGRSLSAPAAAPAAGQAAPFPPLTKACFNANGTFNHENIAAEQRKRAAIVGEALGSRFDAAETLHYLIFSNADAERTRAFTEWAEPLYAGLQRQLNIDPKERAWDGKCIILLFAARQEFIDFAARFDKMDASGWQAYYAAETAGRNYPILMHLCFPVGGRDLMSLQNYFVHEGTHAFFRTYRGSVRLPLWLDEGLSEYMMVYNDPSLRAAKRAPAEAAARAGKPIADILEYPSTAVLTLEEYSVCYTLADLLLSRSGPRTKDFVEALKRRQPQGSAIQTSFGFDLAGMEERWRASLTGESGPGKRRPRNR
ncbi:MAG: hypothetical protein FJ288_11775 [Planctomycetes bacterium]|nr:hypothetical protein [Planctomycetota bacterium]